MENTREIVLEVLLTLEKEQELSHRLIRTVLDKYEYLDARDRAFIKRLTEGTLERRIELDYYLDQYSSVPVRKMKPLIRCLMRMSVYQLLYMDGIPDSAVCNEACKLAGKRKFQNLKGFVNGVLRKIAREKESLTLPDQQKNPREYLRVKYSMPEEILGIWLEEYGFEMTEKLLGGLMAVQPVSLRLSRNLSPEDRGRVAEHLRSQGIRVRESICHPDILLADGVEGIAALSDFAEGRVTVQDASSALSVMAAGIRPGDLVIDTCAAPGGKSLLAAEYTGPTGSVICGDVSESKTDLIRENILRMKADNLQVHLWDARVFDPALENRADVLLLDIPCSGLGVMGKKRDIKYHITREGLFALEELQKEILQNVWKYVKPGGILLYSTCTIRSRENREMVKWILEHLPFEASSVEPDLPKKVWLAALEEKKANRPAPGILTEQQEACCVQLLPGMLETDGFFFAKLSRKKQ